MEKERTYVLYISNDGVSRCFIKGIERANKAYECAVALAKSVETGMVVELVDWLTGEWVKRFDTNRKGLS